MVSAREQALLRDALPAYEVGQELGRGAFGIVYLGHHRQLGREVAIKQLPRAFAADPAVRERFVAEAQMVARLDHPHIVPVYDFLNRDDGLCVLIMERCSGAVSDRFAANGLATDEAAAAVLACCAALEFAHAHGVLHRDIKPENLLFDTNGVIKLADFGIARAIDASATRRTATGMVIGTPAYMSPEQVRGEELTPASDVYSTGIMAYELLSGRLPFPTSSSATGLLAHHMVTPPTPLSVTRPELPNGIGAVIDRALAKDLAERYPSALAFATDLTRACVVSFGAGWLRRRRFPLHWPEIIAESEQARGDGARTGTIVVRADHLRKQMIGAPPAAAASGESAPGIVLGKTTEDRADAAEAPPTGPLAVADRMSAPTIAPSRQAGGRTGGQAGGLAGGLAGAAAPASGGRSRRTLLIGLVGAIAVAVVGALVLFRGGKERDGDLAGEAVPDASSVATISKPSAPATTAATTAATTSVSTTSEFLIPRPADAPLRADSAIIATPCPREPTRVACITSVIDRADGTLIASYVYHGFVPELEPANYHLHFYLDSAVGGDERKAGSEIAGGSWKPWDGKNLTFTSFGGENGRTGFTVADVVAAKARFLCVIVADAQQRALPGTGNCAPLILTETMPPLALEQFQRIKGTYAGRCAIGVTLILPDGWRAVDLVANTPAAAAGLLGAADATATEAHVRGVKSAGGVLWGEGAQRGVRMTVSKVSGEYTTSDAPSAVVEKVRAGGRSVTGTVVERTLIGRPTAIETITGPDGTTTRYYVPDFGYAIVVEYVTPRGADLTKTTDAIAATVLGC